jgi:hypothetical protein
MHDLSNLTEINIFCVNSISFHCSINFGNRIERTAFINVFLN